MAIRTSSPTETTSLSDQEWAKAYCGPAHGYTWRRETASSWPPRIVLTSRSGPYEYRLVHDLRAHRPARDHLGNTLYMPAHRGNAQRRRNTTA